MVGDAVGVKLPGLGELRPATPPPDFDMELAIASLHRFAGLRPELLVLTHYGPVADPQQTLADAEEALRRWVDVAEQAMSATPEAGIDEVTTALAGAFAPHPESIPDSMREKFEVLNGVRSNATGIVRYLGRRQAVGGE
jgi:hypothetical protein